MAAGLPEQKGVWVLAYLTATASDSLSTTVVTSTEKERREKGSCKEAGDVKRHQ
jgi:hypothetical protein